MTEQDQGAAKRREITFSLGPLKLVLRGYDVLLTLILCALVAVGVYGFVHIDASAQEHKTIMAKQDKQEEQLNELTYVLTLSQEKREQLGLQMPDSLRKKTIRVSQ